MFRADPNDNTKQIPYGLPKSNYGQADTPLKEVVTGAPSYIVINNTGSYAFAYAATSSIGSALAASSTQYVTGAVNDDNRTSGLPLKLEISPFAWKRTNAVNGSAGTAVQGKTGDVTFIYKGAN